MPSESLAQAIAHPPSNLPPFLFVFPSRSLARSLARERKKENSVRRSSAAGALSTSLPEDVAFLVDTQVAVLRGYLESSGLWEDSARGAALFADGMLHVVHSLMEAQRLSRRSALVAFGTLEDCCAASNDFLRLAEKMESLLEKLHDDVPFTREVKGHERQKEEKKTADTGLASAEKDDDDDGTSVFAVAYLNGQWNEYVSQLSRDAVSCAEQAQQFAMRAITRSTTIASDLFGRDWEDVWTNNEVACRLVDLVDDFLSDLYVYLSNDYCYRKAAANVCKAVVCFYVRCLVVKAESVSKEGRRLRRTMAMMGMNPSVGGGVDLGIGGGSRGDEPGPFRSASRALMRMRGDIRILKDYFSSKADGDAALSRIVSEEMYILELIRECLDAGDEDSLQSFIVVIHKRTGADSLVTAMFVQDLWTLVEDEKGKSGLNEAMMGMEQDLHMVTARMKEVQLANAGGAGKKKDQISFVRLDEMLKALYEDRLVHGALPACWACLPRVEADDGHEVVAKKIRKFTRSLAEMRWNVLSPVAKKR